MKIVTLDREQAAREAEKHGFVVIDKAEAEDHLAYLRETSEGLGLYKTAAEAAISYLWLEIDEAGE